MNDFEVIPIDEEGPSIIDELPTEDTDEEPVIDDIQDDPSVPEGGEPESTEEAPEPEPDRLIYASEVDELPTEDTDEQPVIDDEPDGGEQPYEPDINDNVADIPIVGSAHEGDVIPVLMRSGAPLGISPVGWGDRMQSDVDLASQAATEAKAVAQATGQHFWEDDNGAHVTEITKDDWKAEEAKETPFADVSDSKPYHNLLMNSLGILLRTALKNLVSITRSAIAFFDGEGNNAANVVASFGKDGAQVGPSSRVHSVIEPGSFTICDRNETTFVDFHLANDEETGLVLISYQCTTDGSTKAFTVRSNIVSLESVRKNGTALVEGTDYTVSGRTVTLSVAPKASDDVWINYRTDEPAPAFTFGTRAAGAAVGQYSIAEGSSVESSDLATHAEGMGTHAGDACAHAEGFQSSASGECAHAEGNSTQASGENAHAEGNHSKATGLYSHSEGGGTEASGQCAHAEGYTTKASGICAHSEGHSTVASGNQAHATGLGTIASGNAQMVLGKFNAADANKALIIGNGTSDTARSNALTVGWDGSVNAAGNAEVGGSVVVKDQTIDRDGAHASADKWHTVHKVLDADGDTIEEMRVVRRASGRMDALWSVYNDNNGAKVENTVRIGVNEDGTNAIGLTGGAAWRTAIGAQASIAETTVNVSSVSIPVNGQTLVQGTAPSGKTACIGCYFDVTSATSPVVLVSAPVHYGPNWRTRLMNYSGDNNTVSGTMHYFWV